MPNIVAHNHIAAQVCGPELYDFMLGSTLPDFKGMHNDRYGSTHGKVELDDLNPMATAGVSFHNLTDKTFDAQPEYPQMTGPLSEDLRECGVPYKAARLAAAFSVDVLVDKMLIENCAVPLRNFNNLRNASMHGEITAYTSMDERLVDHVRRYLSDYGPTRYSNMRDVGMMVYQRLKHRTNDPQKRFSPYLTPAVEQIIEHHADRVGDLGLEALSRTIQILSVRSEADPVETEQSANTGA